MNGEEKHDHFMDQSLALGGFSLGLRIAHYVMSSGTTLDPFEVLNLIRDGELTLAVVDGADVDRTNMYVRMERQNARNVLAALAENA